jgi:hypothetical protein
LIASSAGISLARGIFDYRMASKTLPGSFIPKTA